MVPLSGDYPDGQLTGPEQPGGSPAPGWYPDPAQPGGQRWWDGVQWTQQAQASPQLYAGPAGALSHDSRQMAMLAHLSALLTGFLGPLIFYLIKKDEDPFVADQSREALNFNLSALIYIFGVMIVSFVLTLILIGFFIFFLIFPLMIGVLVLQIIAGIKANEGEWYRYPLTIRMVS